jgi:predicted N-formylglutamate amidohydrolase
MTMATSVPHFDHLMITCEHGGEEVPPGCEEIMEGKLALGDGRVGFDLGAPGLARRLSERFPCTFHINTANRFLVDMNRTPWNRAELFRFATAALSDEEKDRILARVYQPYRLAVEQSVASLIARGGRVLHLSIHSFVPVMKGIVRTTDIGLLYDPARAGEVAFCEAWRAALRRLDKALQIDMNEPYSGLDDGFTLHLRRTWTDATYAGIELEMNQRPLDGNMTEWERRCDLVEASLAALLG